MVWEPVLPTDFAPPSDSALARISDSRAIQFWDRATLTSKDALPILRNDPSPVIGSDSLVTGSIVWDFVAIFPRNARWSDSFPIPVFKGAPVVDVITEFKRRLSENLSLEPAQSGRRDAEGTSAHAR